MATWRAGSILVVALAGACTKQNPRSCADGVCNDIELPFCDVDGTLEGEPNTCIAVSCNGGEFVACRGDQTITCNAMGNNYDVAACENGCNAANAGCNACRPTTATCSSDSVQVCGADGNPGPATTCQVGCVPDPMPHCAYLEPKYLPDICDSEVTADLTISTAMTFSTDLDSNCTGGIVPQTGAPEICVARYRNFVIEQPAVFTAVGQRTFALVSDDKLTITGILDASGNGFGIGKNGPGGGALVSGGAAGLADGAGGAGFFTAGGPGGSNTLDGGAANGGAASTNPAVLTILIGGPQGGGGNGGGGGGAVTLISCRGTVTVDGLIDAGGGGGRGGFLQGGLGRAGSGGGAGGNVVLQGMNVLVTGQLYANGGGGGGGKPTFGFMDASFGNPGDDALRSTSQANGGAPTMQEGRGGLGGAGGRNPGAGGKPGSVGNAGGGGGSVGFLQIYTPAGVTPMVIPAGLSPNFQPSLNVPTR